MAKTRFEKAKSNPKAITLYMVDGEIFGPDQFHLIRTYNMNWDCVQTKEDADERRDRILSYKFTKE